MTTVAATSHVAHAHHDDRSFLRKYIFSTDHKIIGIQFLFVSLFFLLVGGLLAMQMRWQLGFPGKPMPGGGVLPETMAPGGVILPEYYIQLVTMHGTFMVFFAIMPLLVGVFANFLIPLKIGTHDMAFPRINMWSFWTFLIGGLVMLSSLFVPDGAARAGWTMYAPLSARHDYSGASLGQELWSVSIIFVGLSSILGSLNYITTIINNRAPGMTWFRMPLSIWSLFITAILGLLALPVLSGAAIMLLFDQIIGTHFFDPAVGGQALLWQHLFWFFGHPEVYILILPAMGMVSDIISNGSRKPIFGYHSMVFAIVAIAFLGWIVWGHHMFVSGVNPPLGSSFMVSTLVIAVPSAVNTFIFYNCTFFPMHITGMAGEMRRLYDPNQYTFLQPLQPIRVFISISAFLLFASQLIFFVNFWWSLKKGKPAPQNPWEDNGLEWSLPSPAPHGNWEKVPTVYRGPYEFSSPQSTEDYLPQYTRLPTDREPARAPVAGH